MTNPPENIPTPRTDEEIERLRKLRYHESPQIDPTVGADFARQLERDLTLARAERDALKEERNNAFCIYCNSKFPKTQEAIEAHHQTCRDHPIHAIRVENFALKAAHETLVRALNDIAGNTDDWPYPPPVPLAKEIARRALASLNAKEGE